MTNKSFKTNKSEEMTKRMGGLKSLYAQALNLTLPAGKTETAEQLSARTMSHAQAISRYYMPSGTNIDVNAQIQAYKMAMKNGQFISFDTETINGRDQFGANRLDGITELAYTISDTQNQSVDVALRNTQDYFFGITQETYDELYKEMQRPGFANSERGRVVLNRTAIYGHPETKINGNHIISQADLGYGAAPLSQSLSGLKVLLDAGNADRATLKDGMTDGQRFVQGFLEHANKEGAVIAGHNIQNFDIVKMAAEGMDLSRATKLDTLNIFKAASKNLTVKEIFQIASDVHGNLPEKTSYTQENIIARLMGDQTKNLQAHAANVDSGVHSLIVNHPIMQKLITQLESEESNPLDLGQLTPGKSLILNKQSTYGDYHSLSMLTLPTGELNIGNGYSLIDGKMVANGFSPGIMKKDALYVFEGVDQMPLTKEQRAAMKLVDADYAQEALNYAIYTPYGAEDTIQGNGKVLEFFKSKEHMQKKMNGALHIGDKTSGEAFELPTNANARKIALDELMEYDLSQDKPVGKALELNDYLKKKTFNAKMDRSSRRVRDHNINDTEKLLGFMEEVQAYADKHKIIEPITNIHFSDMQLSARLANNESISIQDGLKIMSGHIGNDNVKYNTVDNLIGMTPFMYKNQETVRQVFDYAKGNYKSKTQQEQAYKSIMTQIIDNVKNSDNPLLLSKNDLNYIEVPLEKLKSDRKRSRVVKTSEDLAPKYLRVDLDKNNAGPSLVNNLLTNKHGGKAKRLMGQDKEMQGRVVLDDLVKVLNLKGIDANDYDKANDMADAILIELKNKKEKNLFYGIHQKTRSTPIENGIASIAELYKNQGVDLTQAIEEATKNVPVFQNLEKANAGHLAQKVVKNFNQQVDPNYFYNFNFEKRHADYMTHMYSQWQKEQESFYTSVFENLKNFEGLGLVLDDKQFKLTYGGEVYDMMPHMPHLKVQNDMAYVQLGNMEVALQSAIHQNKKAGGRFELGTVFQRSVDKSPVGFNIPKGEIKEGIKNPAEVIESMFKHVNKYIRESPDVKDKNRMQQVKQFYIDFNEVRNYIPALVQSGDIQVTKEHLAVLKRFADPENTGVMKPLTGDGNSTLNLILNKYLNQASAVLFNTDAYEGSLLKPIGQFSAPYGTEKLIADGNLYYGPNLTAFSEYGPGNRITLNQNNFMSHEVDSVKERMKHLTNGPKVSFDQGATSAYGYTKGVTRLMDFQQLDKQYSDQIVLKEFKISHDNFKNIVEKHFGSGPKDGYTQVQWDKIQAKMRQYGLTEDESIMDARILENIFWDENEVQKIREHRNMGNEFVIDKQFEKTHKALDFVLEEKDGKVEFKYGDSIDRKRNDPLFKLNGYHNTESLTLASYDGQLKKGIFAGKGNIMLTEKDINQLIEGMSKEKAEDYINGLNSYYYLDRKNKEQYVKYIAGNTEKTKGRSLTFEFGELDEELKQLFPTLAETPNATFEELRDRAIDLGASKEQIARIEREHFAVDIQRNLALGDNEIGFVSDPRTLKHKGTDTEFRNLMPSLRQHHMDTEKISAKEAAFKVQENFKGLGFDFEVAEDGSMLFGNTAQSRDMDFTGMKKVVADKYKHIDPDLLEEKVFDSNNRLIGTKGMTNVARTKEYEISIVSQPVKTTEQYREISKQIQDKKVKIQAREMLVKELADPSQVDIKGDETWFEEYAKLKERIETRKRNTSEKINSIEVGLTINQETQNYLNHLNLSIKEYEEVTKNIKYREKLALEYTAIVNDENTHPDIRRRYVTMARENHELLEGYKKLKDDTLKTKQEAMTNYVGALNENTKNKREVQRAIGAANYRLNKYEDKLPEVLSREIKGYERIVKDLNKELNTFSSAYKLKNKGITVDERAFMKLRGKKLTQSIYDNLKATNVSEDTLRKFNITQEAVSNRPIFDNIMNDLIEIGLTDSSHELLTAESAKKTIKTLYGDTQVSEGILKVFNNTGRDKLSIEIAEARYALAKMDNALDFNDNNKTLDFMHKSGFDEINIRHYQNSHDYDAELLKQGNSIFGKNLILDVNGEKVAVPYMPHSVYGGSVVQDQYEGAITNLQRNVMLLDDMVKSDDIDAYEQAEKRVFESMQKVRDSVHLMSAKGSSVADTVTKSKYDLGFLGKSASWKGPEDADLTQAFYKGKSIAQWQEENVFVNAGFTSRKMFEDMGFFSEDLKDSFKDGDVLFGDKDLLVKSRVTDEQLEQAYKKYGVSGLSGRFPYIQEMSVNAKQLYLSDSIKGNTIKNFLAEQQGKSSDNDGDYEAFMALKASTVTGDYENAFVTQALGFSNESLDEHGVAMGLDALGANKYRKQTMDYERLGDWQQKESERILENAKIYDRMFFDGKMLGEATENPFYNKDYSVETVNNKLAELEALTGKALNLDAPDEIAQVINSLDDTADKEGYKRAVIQRVETSGQNLASTAKVMKNVIGEVNLMMLDVDQAAEILADNGHLSERAKKAVGEISYAIQQESISPKNAKDGDINIESINDFKRIANAAKYNKPIEYDGKSRNATEALGLYLDNNIKESYMEKYGGAESPEFLFEMQREREEIYKLSIGDESKAKMWGDRKKELVEGYYEESKSAIQSVFSQVTSETQDVSAYNKLFTRGESTAKYYNTDSARRGVTTRHSLKDTVMQMLDDNAMAYETENVANMVNPSNNTFRHMFATEEDMIQMANQSMARKNVTAALTENMTDGFKVTKGVAGLAVAGIGAYMLMGAVGSSVTANTTNQAEGMQTTGDTLSDYGSSYDHLGSYSGASNGYVINVNAKTSPKNVQKITGKVNQSISSSLNANLNMTLNINENPLKQFQINELIQNSLFSN